MPNWNEVLREMQEEASKGNTAAVDTVRKKYLSQISDITGRNTIAYYSGWLQKPKAEASIVNDKDKSGFMLNVHKLDKSKGLDLILHTPGGDIAATESLVDYLYSIFDKDIRVIVPQIAMSAGTMIALSSKVIVMGKHSNLGPIDPQQGGVSCQAVIDEFNDAVLDIKSRPFSSPLWQAIIGKYHPTYLGSCKRAIEWSESMVSGWLLYNMCDGDSDRVSKIIKIFSDHTEQKSHSRHISRNACISANLNIEELEANQSLQEAVLTTHHAFMHTFLNTPAVKIIENHIGEAYIEHVSRV